MSPGSGFSAPWPGFSTVTADGRKLLPPLVDFWNNRWKSSEVLQSSCTKETSRVPFVSTFGTLNWFDDGPLPSAPGASGTTGVCTKVVRDGLTTGTLSV